MNDIQIEKAYSIKKFLLRMYRPGIVAGNDFREDEHFRILLRNTFIADGVEKEYTKAHFFKNIDDIVDFCISKTITGKNTYFSLATTDGVGGATENLKTAYCLAFDFDKKDYQEGFNHKDILRKFSEIKVKYHALIDSGGGYHVYVFIEPTANIDKVNEVTKAIVKAVRSDENACKKTQVLRVPYTYNVKYAKPKVVRTIFLEEENKIKRYDIDYLYNKFCNKESTNDINTNSLILSVNLKPCVEDILKNGSKAHCNNSDLQKIIIDLKRLNKSKAQIKAIADEWNTKNEVNWSQSELEYQFEYMYQNLNTTKYACDNCKHKNNCKSTMSSQFDFEDVTVLNMNETDMSKLRKTTRKGVKSMRSNDLVVYSILKRHTEGLTRENLIEELTYRGKCLFSKNTLTATLKHLEENDFIKVEKIKGTSKKLYILKDKRVSEHLKFDISFAATYECVKCNITVEELQLYNYIRYLHNKQQREDQNALKGNLFQMNQVQIAKELGITQGRVSQMVNSLLREKIMLPYYKQSKRNNFEYIIYILNY